MSYEPRSITAIAALSIIVTYPRTRVGQLPYQEADEALEEPKLVIYWEKDISFVVSCSFSDGKNDSKESGTIGVTDPGLRQFGNARYTAGANHGNRTRESAQILQETNIIHIRRKVGGKREKGLNRGEEEMAAWRFPTQLATPGQPLRHHHRHRESTISLSLSWRHTLAPLPLSNSVPNPTGRRCVVRPLVRCSSSAATAGAVNLAPGTPVRATSILVVGATGTLGRQIVRRALDEGYDVRCLVRPRPAPADFLRDWGATVVNADLSKPETIPATLVGIHTVIDCATGRPEEPIKTVDWEGKVALIQCAKAMGIQKYVFYSIHNCDKHPEVPLMEIKYCTEKFLQESGLTNIIIRLCGFMQGLIGQYAVPILEEKSVWGTDAPTRIAYMDTQDIARLTFIALRNENINGKLLTFAGPRAWTTQEVVTLCERLAGQDANITTVPVSILRLTRRVTRFFEWSSDVADRLAFSEVLTSDTVFSVSMAETYNLLGVDAKDIVTLEKYLQDYFGNILKKLKDLKAQSKQTDIYF